MRPNDLLTLIKARFTAKILRPLHIEGAPGIGKTTIPRQATRELSIETKTDVGSMTVHGPLQQPEDFGLPVFSADKTTFDFAVPFAKFPFIGSNCPDSGILTIDDVGQCNAELQKIYRNLILEREIHGKRLKPDWQIITTGNRVQDRAGSVRLLSHLSNALTRVELEVSLDDWTQWALDAQINPLVIAYNRFRSVNLNDFDANRDVNPTPRAWCHGVSASLGIVPAHLEFETFKGDIGEGAAAEFCAYLKLRRGLPSVDVILLNPKNAEVPTEANLQYAICVELAHRAIVGNFGAVMTYIKRLPAEFSVLFMQVAIKKTPDLKTTVEFIKWASGDGAKVCLV